MVTRSTAFNKFPSGVTNCFTTSRISTANSAVISLLLRAGCVYFIQVACHCEGGDFQPEAISASSQVGDCFRLVVSIRKERYSTTSHRNDIIAFSPQNPQHISNDSILHLSFTLN